jgi:hypothetical protein
VDQPPRSSNRLDDYQLFCYKSTVMQRQLKANSVQTDNTEADENFKKKSRREQARQRELKKKQHDEQWEDWED